MTTACPRPLRAGLALACLACLAGFAAVQAATAPPAATAPAPGPARIFAPGVISGPDDDSDPAFTPDGASVYFARHGTILVAQRSGDTWTIPRIAPFSGQWADQQPTMAPDGSFLVFVSNRPVTGAPGEHRPAGNLWRIARRGEGWGEPVHLPATVNRGPGIWAPSVAGDGSVYFIQRADPKSPMRMWRSQYRDGGYEPATAVNFGDPTTQDVDAAVAPDESFIVFGSMHPGPDAHERLFIAFRQGAGWGAPVDLGEAVNGRGETATNEARLGPDGRTLYFSTDRTTPLSWPRTRAQAEADLARSAAWDDGNQNIWTISLAPWLEAHRDGA